MCSTADLRNSNSMSVVCINMFVSVRAPALCNSNNDEYVIKQSENNVTEIRIQEQIRA